MESINSSVHSFDIFNLSIFLFKSLEYSMMYIVLKIFKISNFSFMIFELSFNITLYTFFFLEKQLQHFETNKSFKLISLII